MNVTRISSHPDHALENKAQEATKLSKSQKAASIALPIFLLLLTLTISSSIGFAIGAASVGAGFIAVPIAIVGTGVVLGTGAVIGIGVAAGAGIGFIVGVPLTFALHCTLVKIFKRQVEKRIPPNTPFSPHKNVASSPPELYDPTKHKTALTISPGIPNMQGGISNICWMNSVIKLMANTHYYDDIFQKDLNSIKNLSPEKKNQLLELQTALREMILAVRSGKPGSVIDRKYPRRVIQALRKITPEDNYGVDQLDAAEFHRNLQAWFDFPSASSRSDKQSPYLMSVYQAKKAQGVKNVHVEKNGMVEISIPMQKLNIKGPIDITKEYMEVDDVVVRADILLNTKNKSYNPQGSSFIKGKILVRNAPDELFVSINRRTLNKKGNEAKCKRPLLFSKGLTVVFQKFRNNIYISDCNKTYLIPHSQVVYQVKGGTIHLNSPKHYIYVERTDEGRFFYHSDSFVKEISSAKAEKLLKQATILHLEKINEIPNAKDAKYIPLEGFYKKKSNRK